MHKKVHNVPPEREGEVVRPLHPVGTGPWEPLGSGSSRPPWPGGVLSRTSHADRAGATEVGDHPGHALTWSTQPALGSEPLFCGQRPCRPRRPPGHATCRTVRSAAGRLAAPGPQDRLIGPVPHLEVSWLSSETLADLRAHVKPSAGTSLRTSGGGRVRPVLCISYHAHRRCLPCPDLLDAGPSPYV